MGISPQANLQPLTGLRGVAALWVFAAHVLFMDAYHAGIGEYLHVGWLYPLLRFDFIGVDLFIVLSGFLLYRNYKDYFKPKSRGKVIDRFYLLRIARIWPLHMLALGLIALYDYVGITHPLVSGQGEFLMQHWQITLLLNTIMMQSWGVIPGASWNEPAWTVSALFFVYVIFPVWIALVQRAHRRWMQLLGIIVMLLLLEITPPLVGGVSMVDGFGCLLRAFCLFMVGCFTYRLYEEQTFTLRHPDFAYFLLWIALIAGMYLYAFAGPFPLILLHLLYPGLLLSLVQTTGGANRLMSFRPLLFMGYISYGFYILHYPYLLLVGHVLSGWGIDESTPQWLLWFGFALLVGGLAIVSWLATRFIERPCYRSVRRWVGTESPIKPLSK